MGNEARPRSLVLSLVVGFVACVLLRIAVGAPDVAGSARGGLSFAAGLLALSALAGVEVRVSRRALVMGVIAAAALCWPAVLARLAITESHRPEGSFWSWAVIVSVVAASEEVFLRGALRDAIVKWRGSTSAVVIGAILFAVLHLPLYGPRALPLDLGVGLVLGWLRERSRSVAAPAAAHVLADFAAWWLR